MAESSYWLELLVEAEIIPAQRLADLCSAANELTAILITCDKNAKAKAKGEKRKPEGDEA